MSVSLTLDAVRARRKTVTRRHRDNWRDLKAGDRLVLIEKGQGLKKGEKQVVVAEVEVVSAELEPLALVLLEEDGVEREGLDLEPLEFVRFWLKSHGYPPDSDAGEVLVRRIEWRYLEEQAS